MKGTANTKWNNAFLGLVFTILYLPIFYLIFYSFNAGGTMNDFTGFTWEHYQSVFEDTRLIGIVLNTFLVDEVFGRYPKKLIEVLLWTNNRVIF